MESATSSGQRPSPAQQEYATHNGQPDYERPHSGSASSVRSPQRGSLGSQHDQDVNQLQQGLQGLAVDYDQASSLANFPVDRRTSGQSDASFRGPPRGATQSPQLDVYGAYSDHNSMYSDSFRAAPNPYYVDQPQQTHSMATQDSSGPDPYGGLSADQMTDYYATPDLMQPPASPAFPPGPGSYDATFSAPAQQQPHYPGQSALFPPATDQPIPQQFYPPQQQVHGLAPPMPPMPFPGPAGFPSGIPPPHLQRAMSSASSMNIGPYNSSIASSSAVNLNSMQPMPQPSERKRTLSTRSTDDRSRPPITKAAIDEYRNRIKADPDPETQFNFAKYLIEAARKLGQASSKSTAEHEVKALKRYRDSLLQESLKTMKKLATQGTAGKPAYADAQFFYANLLSSGSLGLSVDLEKAYGLYVQASKQNHPAATYRTAFCNEGGLGTKKDYNRAVLFYRKASALGDPVGMFRLGMILLQGLLQQQRNGKEAVTWLNRAAQQADESNPQPLHELASLYERPPDPRSDVGPTVPPDDGMAVELYTQAGKLGYAPSQHKLGGIYEFGALGCPVDPRKSIAWYTRAVERGYGPAELALSGWYLTGSEPFLQQSDHEAFLWAERAAKRALPKAEYAVGYYYEVGIGVGVNVEKAKQWYMRASAQNHKKAMTRLTELKKANQVKAGRKQGRPTRKEAQQECVIC